MRRYGISLRVFTSIAHEWAQWVRCRDVDFVTACIENRKGFAVHSSTWSSGAKDEWCVSSWLAISIHVKKYDTFSRVLLRLVSGLENPCIAVYMIKLYPLFFTLYIVCYIKDQTNKAFNSSICFPLCHSHLIADAFVINASTDSNRKNVFETKSAEVSNNKRTNMSYCITFLIHIACWILCGSDHDKPS